MAKKNKNEAELDTNKILAELITIVEQAGQVAKDIHDSKDFQTTIKNDGSPFTKADDAANKIILDGLHKIALGIPVVSEEGPIPQFSERSTWDHFWLIDPIDGTKEFIRGSGDFTVNVALVSDGKAIMGVVFAPVHRELFFAVHGQGAFQKKDDLTLTELQPHDCSPEQLRCLVSNSASEEHLARIKKTLPGIEITPMGSSRKLCHLAKGNADFYLRRGPTSEWDTAAAHCILSEAGGQLIDLSGETLRYNKEDLANPSFIAFGDPYFDWENILNLTKR